MELVYMDGKKEPYTLSSIVAERAEIKHRHLKILLNKHREDFESFGKVQFKISPSESGQNVRDYILNEQQATLLITYLRNTEPVKEFKKNLVKAFFEMREELSKFRMQRALENPKRKTLHDSIETWEVKPKHAHSTMNNLLLKAVTDRNAKQLREERYKRERVLQLKESENFESLLNKVTDYELELLDYADRLLSDKPIPMDSMTAFGTLEMLGNESINLLQNLDVEGEYKGLADYVAEAES